MESSTFYIHLIHPLVVHFPIVLIFVTLILAGWSFFPQRGEIEGVALTFCILSALAAVLAMLTGERAHEVVHEHFVLPHQALELHKEWGKRSTYYLLSLALVWGAWFFWRREDKIRRLVMALACAVGVGLIILTGRSGGDLVYRHGAGVLPLAAPTLFLEHSFTTLPIQRVIPQPTSPQPSPKGKEGKASTRSSPHEHRNQEHNDDHDH